MPDTGRNDPCPCGSGKKYKNCHLRELEAESAAGSVADRVHKRDHTLVARMIAFAEGQHGPLFDTFDDADPEALQFLIPLALFHTTIGDETIADAFARMATLDRDERRWLEAQRAAWLSVWEIQSVQAGRAMTLRDRLTGEVREVIERKGTRTAVPHLHVLARIVDFDGASYIAGMNPIPLMALEAEDVLACIRSRLRVKRKLSQNRLRGPRAARIVSDCWADLVNARQEAAENRVITNTGGDPFVLVRDRYVFAEADGRTVRDAVLRLAGAVEDDPNGMIIIVHERTVVAEVELARDRLICMTNSLRRADAMREQIESSCGSLVHFIARDVTDPMSAALRGSSAPAPPADPPPEALQALREWKDAYYEKWLDETVPALDGMTPRQAAAAGGRARSRVVALLHDLEIREMRLPPEERIDVSSLRTELQVD